MNTENTEKIQKVNITQQVVEYIQGKIDNNTWAKGEKIESETKIAEKLGVSRVTVRNAIYHFVALGMLESIQGKGTFVKERSSLYFPSNTFSSKDRTDIGLIMQVRASIEQDTAYFAAQNPSQKDIDFLRENIDLMTKADKVGDANCSWGHDMQFHLKIAEMSGNPYYFVILSRVMEQTYDVLLNMVEKIGVRYANQFHPAILDALINHNADLAREMMRGHIMEFKKQLER